MEATEDPRALNDLATRRRVSLATSTVGRFIWPYGARPNAAMLA
jgi:hypothetical protein